MAKDPDVDMDLRHQLKLSRDKIITHYASYRYGVYKVIIEKGVLVGDFLFFFGGLPGFGRDMCKFDSLPPEPHMRDVFKIIGDKFSSYLHYEVFQYILDEYCNASEKDCEKFKYPEYLKVYIEQLNIKEFFEINPELKEFSSTKRICLKMDIEETTKITNIKKLEVSIAAILGSKLQPSDLRLISVEEGCLILTYLIPEVVAVSIASKEMTADQIESLKSLSIHWMRCDESEIFLSGMEDHNQEADVKDPTNPEADVKDPTDPEADVKDPDPEADVKDPDPEADVKDPTNPEADVKDLDPEADPDLEADVKGPTNPEADVRDLDPEADPDPDANVKDPNDPEADVKDPTDPEADVKEDPINPEVDVKDPIDPEADVKDPTNPEADVKDHIDPEADIKDPTDPEAEDPDSEADVKDPDPEADVKDPDPEDDVKDPDPEADVKDPAPEDDVKDPDPEDDVKDPDPEADVKDPDPEADVKDPDPNTGTKIV